MRPDPLLALRRRPRARRALAAAMAVAVALFVQRTVAGADAVRAAWGPRASVVIAARDLPAGHVVEAGDVRTVALPPAATPPGALVRPPTGRTVRAAVLEGEVLTRRRLSDAGALGVAALLPEGARAVAVPIEAGSAPPLRAGPVVDVVAAGVGADGGVGATVVAQGVPVLDVQEQAATVAVTRADLPAVVAALAAGAVTLAVVG